MAASFGWTRCLPRFFSAGIEARHDRAHSSHTLPGSMNTTAPQPEFMLLFRNTQLERRLSPSDMTEAMERLNVWLERWTLSGHLKGGQPLSYDGKTISGAKQRTIADGPFAE